MNKSDRLLVVACLFSAMLTLQASAQTDPPAAKETPAAAPAPEAPPPATLNLDSDQIAKDMSKEKFPSDTKPDTLSSSQTLFDQVMLNGDNRKKVTGTVSAGAGVGTIPAQHGFKGATVNCENTAVAINDAISPTTQVAIAAGVDTCKVR